MGSIINRQHIFSLPEVIREQYLGGYPVQGVLMTPYAMRAFVRVFQILDTIYPAQTMPNVVVTNQGYFEWLSNLDRLDTKRCTVVPVRHTAEINHNADIIFVEIHPNNVVESIQFAHDLSSLIARMASAEFINKQRTLVIDATLNALNDDEIQTILRQANLLIANGWLNIILVQSLTKFSQLGLDKRSAGLLVVINNGRNWANVNQKLAELQLVESVDPSTINFFAYFFAQHALTRQYIEKINNNVRFVYT